MVTRAKPHKWKPRNPKKYIGDYNNIVSRSSWETKFMIFCDLNSSVVNWNSEDIKIPYKSPVDGRFHTYHVDFLITVKDRHDNVKTYLVEVKPFSQTQPPKNIRNKKTLMEATATYQVNQAKWEAATAYAVSRGWEFKVITEYELGLKK